MAILAWEVGRTIRLNPVLWLLCLCSHKAESCPSPPGTLRSSGGSSVQERSDRRVPRSEAVRVRPALPFLCCSSPPLLLTSGRFHHFREAQGPVKLSVRIKELMASS